MTTHDDQLKPTSTPPEDVDPAPRPESTGTMTEPPAAAPDQPAADDPSATTMRTEPPTTESGIAVAEPDPSTTKSLFAEDLSDLRSRWDDVQAAFVDAPKECVEKADALVAEVVEQVTKGFSEARSRLEEQWARGEEASTEDLRLSLKRYREFFQRLLSV